MCQSLSLVTFIGLFGSLIFAIAVMIYVISVVLLFAYKKEQDLEKLVKNLIPAGVLTIVANIVVAVSLIAGFLMLINKC